MTKKLPVIELKQASDFDLSTSTSIEKMTEVLIASYHEKKEREMEALRRDVFDYVKELLKLESRFPGIDIKDLEEVAELLQKESLDESLQEK